MNICYTMAIPPIGDGIDGIILLTMTFNDGILRNILTMTNKGGYNEY